MTTSIIDRLQQTISYTLQLFTHNDEKAKQAAHDWQSRYCAKHHVPRFYDIMKAQAGKPELECWTCNLCEYERRQQALAEPKPKPYNDSPTYTRGSVFLEMKAVEQQAKAELIKRVAISQVPTAKSLTGNPITPIPETPYRENTANPVEQSLILWRDIADPDATEMRPAIKLPRMASKTGDLRVPILIEVNSILAQETHTHPQTTGENERINEDAFLL